MKNLPPWLLAAVAAFALWHFWPQLRSLLSRFVPGL